MRAAVNAANASTEPQNVITFDSSVTGSITLQSKLTLTGSTTIAGPVGGALTLDGGHQSQIFYAKPAGNAPIDIIVQNLTVANGTATNGGCIETVNANLTLANVTLTGCSATNAGGGLSFGNGTAATNLAMAYTTITDCNATRSGGGLASHGDVTINNSIITNNTAGGGGGGIYSRSEPGTFTVDGLTLTGNTSAYGGGVALNTQNANITHALIQNNVASDGAGGGIFALYGAVSLSQSLVSDCNALNGGGGALYAYQAVVSLQQSALLANDAKECGGVNVAGGSLSAEQTTLAGNVGTQSNGGAVCLFQVNPASFDNCTIAGNVGLMGAGILVEFTPVTIAQSTIFGNAGIGQSGGAGVYANGQSSQATLTNSIVAGNTVQPGVDPNQADIQMSNGATISTAFSLVQNGNVVDDGNNIFQVSPVLSGFAQSGNVVVLVPVPTSPGVDAGDPAFSPPPSVDARGLTRVVNGRIDMGAVELQTCGSGLVEGALCTAQTDPCTANVCGSQSECSVVVTPDGIACTIHGDLGTCVSGSCNVISSTTTGGTTTGTTSTTGGSTTTTTGTTGTTGMTGTTSTTGGGTTDGGGSASTTTAGGGTSGASTAGGSPATTTTGGSGSGGSSKSGCAGLPADDLGAPPVFAAMLGGLLSRLRKRRLKSC